MPENLPGSTWNEVSNATGVVLNGAVCTAAVCGRNGEFRNMKNANGKSTPNGFPENSAYIQAPTDGAAWGRYYTNGVYETINGDIYQPGSLTPVKKTVIWVETSTATSQLESKTVSTNLDTRTITTQIEAKKEVTTNTVQSETRTAAVATLSSVLNPELRAATAATLISTFSPTEKEDALKISLKSNKSAIINIATDLPEVNMVVTASKNGSKTIIFDFQTNPDGDASLKTTRNLIGYTVTLSVDKVKIDSDLVRK
jgi:hypothetical protein